MDTFVGFIDETVLWIARPKANLAKKILFNRHKRKLALKCQPVNIPDGLTEHICVPVESRRRDWALYIRSDLEDILPSVLGLNGVEYRIFGDFGNNA